MLAPWAMITPSAPLSGTSISAVTEWDLFLMPPNSGALNDRRHQGEHAEAFKACCRRERAASGIGGIA
jgi:hypothetical protein